jgi:hypothetical protein
MEKMAKANVLRRSAKQGEMSRQSKYHLNLTALCEKHLMSSGKRLFIAQ